jgi:hypothetical protein
MRQGLDDLGQEARNFVTQRATVFVTLTVPRAVSSTPVDDGKLWLTAAQK